MPNTYRNAALADVPNTFTTVYTVPSSTTALVRSIHCANLDSAADQIISLQWLDDSDSDTKRSLLVDATVPMKTAMQTLDAVLVLEAGDVLQAKGAIAAKFDVSVSIVEVTP